MASSTSTLVCSRSAVSYSIAEIRERDFAVHHGEPVICGNLLALLLLLGLGQGFELREPWVDGFLKLEVEDDPADAAALAGDARRHFLVEPVNGGVVPELAGLDELGVVDLAAGRRPAEAQGGLAVAREGRIRGLGRVQLAYPEEALLHEIADFGISLGVVPRVAVLGEVVDCQGTKSADVGERLELGIAELVRLARSALALRILALRFVRPGLREREFRAVLGAGRRGSVPSVKVLPVEMGRHIGAPGIEFAVEMSELAARVFEEKTPAEGQARGHQVEEQDREKEEDCGSVVVDQEPAVGHEEPELVGEEEEHGQDNHGRGENGVSDHRNLMGGTALRAGPC